MPSGPITTCAAALTVVDAAAAITMVWVAPAAEIEVTSDSKSTPAAPQPGRRIRLVLFWLALLGNTPGVIVTVVEPLVQTSCSAVIE